MKTLAQLTQEIKELDTEASRLEIEAKSIRQQSTVLIKETWQFSPFNLDDIVTVDGSDPVAISSFRFDPRKDNSFSYEFNFLKKDGTPSLRSAWISSYEKIELVKAATKI